MKIGGGGGGGGGGGITDNNLLYKCKKKWIYTRWWYIFHVLETLFTVMTLGFWPSTHRTSCIRMIIYRVGIA